MRIAGERPLACARDAILVPRRVVHVEHLRTRGGERDAPDRPGRPQ